MKAEKKKNSIPNFNAVQLDKAEQTDPELKASTFRGRFLEAGLVKYDNELFLLKQESLMNVANEFKGIHMVIEHEDIESDADKFKIAGYVSKIYFEEGWAWCEFVLTSQEAIDLVNKGFELSCSYTANEIEGGTYHAQTFEKEIVGCKKPIHMALVPRGRYEGSYILKNSNPINKIKENIMTLFKFNKKKIETKELDTTQENAFVELEEGKNVSVAELMESHVLYNSIKENEAKEEEKEKKAKEEEEKKKKLNADDEVDVDGQKVRVGDLVNSYKKMTEIKKEEEEKKNQEEEGEKKKKEEEEKKEKENAKKNSFDFEKMEKARNEIPTTDSNLGPTLESERFAMGDAFYSSKGDDIINNIINKNKK